MKQIFNPVSLILTLVSIGITVVCASLLEFEPSGNLVAHSYSIWGDWSAHFTFISSIRERGFSWLAGDNPLFSGIPFRYPFLSHVFTYLFQKSTFLDTPHATYLSSLILIFLLPFTLYTVLRKLNLNPWGSIAALLSFLLMGGLQCFDRTLKSSEPLTNQFDSASIFTQFILFEFFPQRAFLMGLFLFLGAGIFAIKCKKWNLKTQLSFGFILALTPLLHIHTWIAVGTLLIFLCIFPPISQSSKVRKIIFVFGLGVALLSLVFLSFLLLRGDAGNTKLHWNIWLPGWAQNEETHLARASEMNFFVFWIFNTGLFLPLAGYGIWIKRKDSRLRAIACSGICLFLVAEFFNIQPYYYDNLKLFTYSFLFLTPFVGFSFEKIAHLTYLPKTGMIGIATALLLVQITSALLDFRFFYQGKQSTLFFSNEEFELAEQFKTLRKSPEALVLITPRHNHWVPCLAGNPVAMGFPGWLWSWGISYGKREKEIQDVLLGTPNADAVIQDLHIDLAVLQDEERVGDKPINIFYFDSKFKKLIQSGHWRIYSLNDRMISPSTSVR